MRFFALSSALSVRQSQSRFFLMQVDKAVKQPPRSGLITLAAN
ncbi:unnamed protein product [Protopolystoma xenopodis]|uniref:Uncharacterized protein n=1 Tax=Protopolystoma xenopodis TaxID=117903 RepID=A0A448X2B1_9PLAT|nr:unnamed protein product [Protopolystoma xenopodis]